MPGAAAVWIDVLPSMRSFGPTLRKQTAAAAAPIGAEAGKGFGKRFAVAAGAAMAALSVGAALKSSVSLAGDFDKTLRQVGVATGQAGAEMQNLSRLALDMGAKTTFSAQGAADAMLELAKGGLTSAQIEAGALAETLTLATAGGLELGSAAGFMVQGLTTFGLRADQAGQVAAALAGGANASTASVESMGQALSQVGPSAKLAGMTIQETTAALAAFDNAGVKGSDAGTSLKTMLMALTPSTKQAANKMAELGLKFTDAQGQFLPMRDIAEQLRGAMSRLSPEMQTTALKTMFGADAFRAAAILAEQGGAGIDKFAAATSDLNAAQDLAAVGTQGFSGAMEQFRGAVETAQIQVGTKLLPVLTGLLNFATDTIMPALSGMAGFVGQNSTAFKALGAVLVTGAALWGTYTATVAIHTAVTKGVTAVTKAWTAVTKGQTIAQAALNVVMRLNPIGLVVTALVALGAGLVLAYKKSETFRNIVQRAWEGIKAAASAVWEGYLKPALAAMGRGLKTAGEWAQRMWTDYVRPAFERIGSFISTAWNRVIKPVFGFLMATLRTVARVFSWLWTNAISPALRFIGAAIRVLWGSFVRPIFGMIVAYVRMVAGIYLWLWTNAIRPALGFIGERLNWLWRTIVRPVFNGIKTVISTVWNKGIKPVFERLKTAVGAIGTAFGRARDAVGRAWNGLKEKAAAPIRFVIDTVYNNGIRKVWNKVIETFGGTPLNAITFGQGPALPVRSSMGGNRQFAKGGYAPPGWALVGEEGPELVNFTTPGRVYTAEQTAAALGMGGPADWARNIGRSVANVGRRVRAGGEWVKDRAEDLGEISLGGLRKAAEFLFAPVRDLINSGLGGTGFARLVRRVPHRAIDEILDFLGRKDKEMPAGLGSAPAFDGPIAFPLPRGSYTVGAGFPFYPSGKRHTGWDFPARTGTPVFAPFPGHVSAVNMGNRSYGRHVNLVAGALRFIGAHLSAFGKTGMVNAGDLIGRVGSSGNSTGPHLHAEFRRNGQILNPRSVLSFDNGGPLPPGYHLVHNGTGGTEWVTNPKQLTTTPAAAPTIGALTVQLGDREITDIVRVQIDGRDAALTNRLAYGGM